MVEKFKVARHAYCRKGDNFPCQVHRGAVKAYGELKDFQDLVPSEAGDGSRSSEIF